MAGILGREGVDYCHSRRSGAVGPMRSGAAATMGVHSWPQQSIVREPTGEQRTMLSRGDGVIAARYRCAQTLLCVVGRQGLQSAWGCPKFLLSGLQSLMFRIRR